MKKDGMKRRSFFKFGLAVPLLPSLLSGIFAEKEVVKSVVLKTGKDEFELFSNNCSIFSYWDRKEVIIL